MQFLEEMKIHLFLSFVYFQNKNKVKSKVGGKEERKKRESEEGK